VETTFAIRVEYNIAMLIVKIIKSFKAAIFAKPRNAISWM
jgi:hypothetical protein